MSVTVDFGEIMPSQLRGFYKSFSNSTRLNDPYNGFKSGTHRAEFSVLAEVIHEVAESKIKISQGRSIDKDAYPNDFGLKELVAILNDATDGKDIYQNVEVPGKIRNLQFLYFYKPEISGVQYSFGLMMHDSPFTNGFPKEFAAIFPRKVDSINPGWIVSNNYPEGDFEALCLMEQAVEYGAQFLEK
jgi:hypothetical protein